MAGNQYTGMITGTSDPITVGDIRAATRDMDDDVEITFGSTLDGTPLKFYRFKMRGKKLLQFELNEDTD